MPHDFIELAPGFYVSPQITPDDVDKAQRLGVRLIINNRPDGEEPVQPPGAVIEAAARKAGIGYAAIPVGPAGVSDAHLDAFDRALEASGGPVLAYCRSGTRSTHVRALARARAGIEYRSVLDEAAAAGFNLAGLQSRLQAISKSKRN